MKTANRIAVLFCVLVTLAAFAIAQQIGGAGHSNGQTLGGPMTSSTLTLSTPVERCKTLAASGIGLGNTAPSEVFIGTFTALEFDNDAETVNFDLEAPSDWTASTDGVVRVYFSTQAEDIIANEETVKWDVTYRCINVSSNAEPYDNGTVGSKTGSYAQSGAGTEKSVHVAEITIDWDDTNQPTALNDMCGFEMSRDVAGDTYSGAANVFHIDVCYQSNSIPTHF